MGKRVAAWAMVLVVVCTLVAFPGLVGSQEAVQALTNDQRVLSFSPAFWAWQASQWAAEGIQVQNLGEALNQMNKGGQIDAYLNQMWADFQKDVQQTVRVGDTYFRATAEFWRRTFTNDWGNGVQQVADGSDDPASPYYVNPASSGQTNYGLYPAIRTTSTSALDWWKSNFGVTSNLIEGSSGLAYTVRDWILQNGQTQYQVGTWNLTTSEDGLNAFYWYQSPGVAWMNYSEYQRNNMRGRWVLMLLYRNPGGAPAADGSIYRLVAVPMLTYGMVGSPTYVADRILTEKEIDGSVTNAEYETITPITFDMSILDHPVTADDVSDPGAYVGTVVDDLWLTEFNMMLERVRQGTATVADIDMPVPGTDVKTETNVPAIQTAIPGAVAVPEVAVPNFPQVEQFRLPMMITTRFPFSIPWDFKRAVEMMSQTAETPKFVLPFVIDSIGFRYDIEIDMEPFSYLARIMRWFVLALFLVGLILATRGMIKA